MQVAIFGKTKRDGKSRRRSVSFAISNIFRLICKVTLKIMGIVFLKWEDASQQKHNTIDNDQVADEDREEISNRNGLRIR